ncbi:MAG: hypothetical protein A2Y33_12275 [Spirochaetes bacterium GWF1_51_8]|nr:MAG: hypothetical protein A2Y33_12275 [Spirochaetes bacterium GWF1_51_8]
MPTVKEVLERLVEMTQKLDVLVQKLDDYKAEQNKVNNDLEKRMMKIEDRQTNCRADVTRRLDELRPERRRDRIREWMLFLLTAAGVAGAVLIPMTYLVQRIIQSFPKNM